jgi:dual oxidase maturation factor 1
MIIFEIRNRFGFEIRLIFFLVGISGCGWHTAEAEISVAYKSFSNEKIDAIIGVYIGLDHVNVTLSAMPNFDNHTIDVNFNERLNFGSPTDLKDGFKAALQKGLPFPILTVAEYMSVDAEGFCWGRNYRQAGYYGGIFLW